MKKILHIRNFGKIKRADIDLQQFVLFVGDNNSGKTYIMQLIYGILDYIENKLFRMPPDMPVPQNIYDYIINNENLDYYINLLNQNIKKDIDTIILETFNKNISVDEIWFEIDMEDYEINCKVLKKQNIEYFFNKAFDNQNVVFNINLPSNEQKIALATEVSMKNEKKEEISSINGLCFVDVDNNGDVFPKDSQVVISSLLPMLYTTIFNLMSSSLYLPSSRAGLHLLYKDYFLSKGDIDFNKRYIKYNVINNINNTIVHDSTLTKPVYNYLRFLQKWALDNRVAEYNYKLINFLENYLIDGSYQKNENMEYIPRGSDISIPLYLSSSMISELIPYYYFICSQDYDTTSYLMIDEAESSLHPKKQFELVRLLVRLNNQNKTIIMSTHSDSLAAKINNIVLLSNKFKNKDKSLLKKYKLTKDDLLKNSNIKVYSFSNEGAYSIVDEVPYNRKLGFTFEGFEDALDSLIREVEEIYKD